MADKEVYMAEKSPETPLAREKLEAQIKSADMTEDMQQESIEVGMLSGSTRTAVCDIDVLTATTAQEAMAKFTIEKLNDRTSHSTLSARSVVPQHRQLYASTGSTPFRLIDLESNTVLSAQFDERKGPTWHCIVGRNFGSFVTHETKHFIYFYLGHCAILLFKTQ
ncbi:hypothetical protein LLEC1_00719 [Akanthomyces lecanii]|uniref:Dynein light chain n=1 Tax=Cordyceps confragosa TaxID=2714763 RepID=A0A179IDN9_CORDF|nr:hypothetical protein LLEC1_00719 [Akanthomyces lecanii]